MKVKSEDVTVRSLDDPEPKIEVTHRLTGEPEQSLTPTECDRLASPTEEASVEVKFPMPRLAIQAIKSDQR